MSTSDSSTYSKVSPAVTVVATTGIIVGGAVLIVVAILIIKCVEKTKLRSVSAEEQLPTVTATGSHGSALRKDSTVDMEPIYRFLEDVEKERPMRFTPHHLVHFTNNYAEKLGSGGFGVVYGGRFPNGVKVAVKVLRGTTTSDKRAEERFMAEIGTICRTSHANLVRLYGFCFDKITRALVYEYMEKGSLDQYLFNHKDRIEWGKLREIAIGAAKAIRYLHEEHEQKVVHYDIKPGNILLDADFTPRCPTSGWPNCATVATPPSR
ncbi:STYKc [Musa troglodytarum]|uniref:STYKc n=1 Tax=Musa troglodytarum TaxID=320322 RepID=A0A9E7H9L3_9LILI|nr:STYKc [Musa troglodytarum]